MTFEPDLSGTAVSGGVFEYTHIVTNTGNATDYFKFGIASSNGWTYVIYNAVDGFVTQTPNLTPGATYTVVVRGFVPNGTAPDTVETVVVTATSNNSGTVSDNVTDTTIIIAGVLRIRKVVANITDPGKGSGSSNTGVPGEELKYSLDYQNLASSPVTNVVVVDTVPSTRPS